MKPVGYTNAAISDLRKYRADAARIVKKVERYAQSGVGDVKQLKGSAALQLQVGNYRVIFEESATTLKVTKIGPRGGIYD
jgi:mRNA interferase RelE/StbE